MVLNRWIVEESLLFSLALERSTWRWAVYGETFGLRGALPSHEGWIRLYPLPSRKLTHRPTWKLPDESGKSLLPRKEVIQPHLPVLLPCYDFVPVTSPALDGSLP